MADTGKTKRPTLAEINIAAERFWAAEAAKLRERPTDREIAAERVTANINRGVPIGYVQSLEKEAADLREIEERQMRARQARVARTPRQPKPLHVFVEKALARDRDVKAKDIYPDACRVASISLESFAALVSRLRRRAKNL